MTRVDDIEARLEARVASALRDLPPRSAPAALEERVIQEIRRRMLLPWWRRSFAQWTASARLGFIVASAGAVSLSMTSMAGSGVSFPTQALLEWIVGGTHRAGGFIRWADEPVALLWRVVPAEWLRIGFAFGVLLYLALFGLGAAAYRTLYLAPPAAGERS